MAKYDGGAYGKNVCEGRQEDGTDIHSVNRDALGLEGKRGRDQAKTFFYAFLFGAGDLKLGRQIGCTPEEVAEAKKNEKQFKSAKAQLARREEATDDYTVACFIKGGKLRAKFLKNLPALSKLSEAVKKTSKQNGFLLLHDGRRVPIRYQHAALNSLLQGGEAVVCKRWIVRFNRRLTAEFGEQGWDGQWVALGWIHDEVQLAVRPHIVDRVKQILIEEMAAVAVEFNMRVPLLSEAQTGSNWAECH
jgi:DNA polymerase I